MNCVDCGNKCVNRCSSCNKGYCAPCRDVSGKRTCLSCRAAQQQARQQRLANLQQSRQAQATRRQVSQQVQQQPTVPGTPIWIPPVPQPLPLHMQPTAIVPTVKSASSLSQRPTLAAMSTDEFVDWCSHTHTAIAQAKTRMEEYLSRRASRGTHTPTDTAMERDVRLLNDLEQAVYEIAELRSQMLSVQRQWGDELLVSYDEKLKVV